MIDDIKDKIINKALEIGFADIRFVQIRPWEDELDFFENWLAKKHHADMHYLERNIQLRNNPKEILPSAKTMIVTATNYYTPNQHSEKEGLGKISRYCWGEDYHKVLKRMLKKLVKSIYEFDLNSKNRFFVDSGPILEKQWAIRSGIGWQGKNSLIIHPELGTWFFLGVVLTSIDIEADMPFTKDLCKDCTKCIDSCPTNAIISPRIIDANKCIAYHTIETKAETNIPDKVRSNMNSWLFGCDTCQDVCPWNTNVEHTKIEEFYLISNPIEWNLNDIIDMEEIEFSNKFHNSSIKRTGLKALHRNACALRK